MQNLKSLYGPVVGSAILFKLHSISIWLCSKDKQSSIPLHLRAHCSSVRYRALPKSLPHPGTSPIFFSYPVGQGAKIHISRLMVHYNEHQVFTFSVWLEKTIALTWCLGSGIWRDDCDQIQDKHTRIQLHHCIFAEIFIVLANQLLPL